MTCRPLLLILLASLVGCGGGGGGGGTTPTGPGSGSGLTPPPATYQLGGMVSGLEGAGLVLQNRDGSTVAIAANGAFKFDQPVAGGTAFSVSVKTAPTGPAQT